MKNSQNILEHACAEKVKHRIIVLSDSKEKSKNKTKMQIENPKQSGIWKIKVDDCFEGQEKYCDFLIMNDSAHFIELKSTLNSTKFKESVRQLKNSYSVVSEQNAVADKLNPLSFYIIVKKKQPRFESTIQIAKKEFRLKYKSELFIKNSGHTITL